MSIEAMKLALEALVKLSDAADGFSVSGVYFNEEHWAKECLNKSYDAMTALRQSIEQAQKQEALDRKAENARELGLDYEPEPVRLECVKCGTVYADGIPPQTTQKQEPVAFICEFYADEGHPFVSFEPVTHGTNTPLYASPPQRQPLTDEQYFEIGQRHWLPSNKIEQIHKEIEEAAHGIKE